MAPKKVYRYFPMYLFAIVRLDISRTIYHDLTKVTFSGEEIWPKYLKSRAAFGHSSLA
jgi:hypothetical protein